MRLPIYTRAYSCTNNKKTCTTMTKTHFGGNNSRRQPTLDYYSKIYLRSLVLRRYLHEPSWERENTERKVWPRGCMWIHDHQKALRMRVLQSQRNRTMPDFNYAAQIKFLYLLDIWESKQLERTARGRDLKTPLSYIRRSLKILNSRSTLSLAREK